MVLSIQAMFRGVQRRKRKKEQRRPMAPGSATSSGVGNSQIYSASSAYSGVQDTDEEATDVEASAVQGDTDN